MIAAKWIKRYPVAQQFLHEKNLTSLKINYGVQEQIAAATSSKSCNEPQQKENEINPILEIDLPVTKKTQYQKSPFESEVAEQRFCFRNQNSFAYLFVRCYLVICSKNPSHEPIIYSLVGHSICHAHPYTHKRTNVDYKPVVVCY